MPRVARRQMDAELPTPPSSVGPHVGPDTALGPTSPTAPLVERTLRRFHGTVSLDPTRVGRDASRIADEVIAHLAGLAGVAVEVTLEISARVQGGIPEKVVRIVTENGRTLKFSSQGFETE